MSNIVLKLEISGIDDLFDTEAFNESLSNAFNKMAIETKNFWTSIAGQRLKSTRAQYQDAIKLDNVTSRSFSLVLDGGFLVWALEVGTGPYPMNLAKGKVAPLNVNREIQLTNPTTWRTGGDQPWNHPGFEGFHMIDDVIEELKDTIAPKHIKEALDSL
jgi:hypothetical protein